MGVYAVTGARSGMGKEVVERLRKAGHDCITVDLADADVTADLSTSDGRRDAADEVLQRSGGVLDGAVMAAGLGPTPGTPARRILEVNYAGTVELLRAWRPALAASGEAKVVVFSSNSTTTMPLVPRRAVKGLLDDDTAVAERAVRRFGGRAPTFAYGASKIALSRWVRRAAVTKDWAGAGIRLNAIAPGAIRTPLLEAQLADPKQAKLIKTFPVPVGGFGEPGDIAEWTVFMLSPAAKFLCGSVVFVDGGTDAYFRADDWPRPVPLRGLPAYGRRFKRKSTA
jgi:NAD(P)-dependent dehydrogenase (short-subunit alcohol dehydrogenase family)